MLHQVPVFLRLRAIYGSTGERERNLRLRTIGVESMIGDNANQTTASGPSAGKDRRQNTDKPPVPQSPYDPYRAFQIFVFPALGGLLFGYDIGATSVILTQIQDAEFSGVTWYNDVAKNTFLQGFITSSGVIGAMLGSLIIFAIADDIGRRYTMLIAGVLYLVGSIFEGVSAMASDSYSTGLGLLFTGSIIYGLGCGFAMHGAPAYIGEMAPSAIRGLLVSMKEAFIVLGMVFGYSLGFVFHKTPGGWGYTYGLSGILALAFLAGIWSLPFSARWLALKGRNEEARESLKFVTPGITDSEVQEVFDAAEEAQRLRSEANAAMGVEREDMSTFERWGKLIQRDYRQMSQPATRAALVAGIGVVVFQQVTGQPSVLYYANTIFDSVGLSGASSIGVSIFKLIMTLATTFTVERYGRRLLLFIGCGVMLLALAMLGVLFYLPTTTATQYAILSALILYIGGYQVGFGPIAWLFISEIFPLEVRGKAVSLAVITNFFWNGVMSLIFPTEIALIGAGATFIIYGVILFIGIIFIYRYVPETKGLSLEEITRLFEGRAAEEERTIREELLNAADDVNSPLLNTNEAEQDRENPEMAI